MESKSDEKTPVIAEVEDKSTKISQDNTSETEKRGRPKGSKSRADIPIKTLEESVDLTKKVYESYKDASISPTEIADTLGLPKASIFPVLGALDKYRLMENDEHGWHVTDLGKKAIRGERQALGGALEGVPILKRLSTQFLGKGVSRGIIEDFIRKNYRQGENVELIATKFLDAKNYIEGFTGTGVATQPSVESVNTIFDTDVYEMAILFGQLFPPETKEVNKALSSLSELADKKGLKKFSGFVEGLKFTLGEEKDGNKIESELKKLSNRAKELFENELGIKKQSKNSE